MRKPKSAECEIFYHPKKPKKMFCPEDIAKDYYTIWILRFLIGGTIIATDFLFLIYYKMRKAGQ